MGVHTQIVRLGMGSNGENTTLVSQDNPLPVVLTSGNVVISGPVTISTEVEIKNEVGNPIPVVGPLTEAQLRAAPVPVTTGQITSLTATIASGASISGDIDLGTARLGRIAMPAAWTAADLTLQTSHDGTAGSWNSLYDKDGTEYTIKAAQARSMLIPLSDMLSVRYLRIRSGTSAAPVAQAAARSLLLVLVP